MSMRKILVDDTNRELCPHGTESFPMTVSHDDLWDFEGKSVPIHWHNDLEISLPRKGESIYQIYQKSYHLNPGEGLLINRNVPHSCHSPGNQPDTAPFWSARTLCTETLEVMWRKTVSDLFFKTQQFHVFF